MRLRHWIGDIYRVSHRKRLRLAASVPPFDSPDCRGLGEECVLVLGFDTNYWF
jgi:hypothetical protein